MTQSHYVYYDREADALYVTLPGKEETRVAHTDCIAAEVNIDYDGDNEIVGVEVLGVSTLPAPPPAPESENT